MAKYTLIKTFTKLASFSNQFEKISINPNNGQTSCVLQSVEEKKLGRKKLVLTGLSYNVSSNLEP